MVGPITEQQSMMNAESQSVAVVQDTGPKEMLQINIKVFFPVAIMLYYLLILYDISTIIY